MTRPLIATMAATAVIAGALALPATAQADGGNVGGPFTWCPGDSMQYSPEATYFGGHNGPGAFYTWDMNVCHTWYRVRNDKGNVPYQGSLTFSSVWDGDNPPAGQVLPPLKPCVPAPLPCL